MLCKPSTVLQNQRESSTVLLNHREPSTVLQNHREPSTVLQNNCEPSTVLQNNCEPSTVLQNHREPSTVLQNHCEPSTVFQNHCEPSTVLQNHHKPSCHGRIELDHPTPCRLQKLLYRQVLLLLGLMEDYNDCMSEGAASSTKSQHHPLTNTLQDLPALLYHVIRLFITIMIHSPPLPMD
ncbi:keratin-associated protein 26-1-like [Halichondria panicea]|uniref:keratin-associated protein 26-1-like n=1 Tax=Halichondria panicea TaxID=6063 RepID=UPI00312BA393